eukprot:403366023
MKNNKSCEQQSFPNFATQLTIILTVTLIIVVLYYAYVTFSAKINKEKQIVKGTSLSQGNQEGTGIYEAKIQECSKSQEIKKLNQSYQQTEASSDDQAGDETGNEEQKYSNSSIQAPQGTNNAMNELKKTKRGDGTRIQHDSQIASNFLEASDRATSTKSISQRLLREN